MDRETAQLVFCDLLYNVPVHGHVCGNGAIRHREFAMAAGEMDRAQFTAFLSEVFTRLVAVSQDGAIHFLCMDWRHMGEILATGEVVYAELKNQIVWAKDNGGMGGFYRSHHELIFASSRAGRHISAPSASGRAGATAAMSGNIAGSTPAGRPGSRIWRCIRR